MAAIAKVQTNDRNINQLQQNIITSINPLIKNPLNSGQILQNVKLAIGMNVIPTGLNRKLQGWFVVRLRALSDIYDQQDNNSNPGVTLLLNSSAQVVVDLYVF